MTNTDEITRLQIRLQERFPSAFPADPSACRPLKVGIREDIISEMGGEFELQVIHVALAKHTGRRGYLRALARGGVRIDLTGQASGEVTPEQMAHAQEKLKVLSERAKERKGAATKPVEAQKVATPAVDTPAPLPAQAHVPAHPILSLKRKRGA